MIQLLLSVHVTVTAGFPFVSVTASETQKSVNKAKIPIDVKAQSLHLSLYYLPSVNDTICHHLLSCRD